MRLQVHAIGNTGARLPFGVLAPGVLGHVEPTVDQHPSLAGSVGKKHSDLGILDSSRCAGVLPLDAR